MGVPVFGSDATVNFDPTGKYVRAASLLVDPNIEVNIVPSISENQVRDNVSSHIKGSFSVGQPTLKVYSSDIDHRLDNDFLAYIVEMTGTDEKNNYRNVTLILDAHNGRIVDGFESTYGAINRVIHDLNQSNSKNSFPGAICSH